jgi:hypothetical protein
VLRAKGRKRGSVDRKLVGEIAEVVDIKGDIARGVDSEGEIERLSERVLISKRSKWC